MRENICKHFKSPVHHKECEKGIVFTSWTNGERFGLYKKIPCNKGNGVGVCRLAVYPTTEEVAEFNKKVTKSIKAQCKAIKIIKEKHKVNIEWENPSNKNKNVKGFIECPKCGGKLYYTISSYNGHIWGKCETDKCLAWMM